MTDAEMTVSLGRTIRVQASDYSYVGKVRTAFMKGSGQWRCVVEDDCGRLFIHNAGQLQLEHRKLMAARFKADATPFVCPTCHSTDWLTSTEIIREPKPTLSENGRMVLGFVAAALILVGMYTAVFFAPCDSAFWRGFRAWYHLECPK